MRRFGWPRSSDERRALSCVPRSRLCSRQRHERSAPRGILSAPRVLGRSRWRSSDRGGARGARTGSCVASVAPFFRESRCWDRRTSSASKPAGSASRPSPPFGGTATDPPETPAAPLPLQLSPPACGDAGYGWARSWHGPVVQRVAGSSRPLSSASRRLRSEPAWPHLMAREGAEYRASRSAISRKRPEAVTEGAAATRLHAASTRRCQWLKLMRYDRLA